MEVVMVTVDCPWCEAPVLLVQPDAVWCEGCRVEVEIEPPAARAELPIAA
jgi:hypothetical protein